MASKVRNLSSLVDKQLPEFISSEYPKFSAFLQKYYEHLELTGEPIDLISNLSKYRDIDTYEKNLLNENTSLSQNLSDFATTINVESTVGFPSENGYVLIGDEAIFYKSKTNTSFLNCYRNITHTTKLGDLYSKPDITVVDYADVGEGKQHLTGDLVVNISNLVLYALVRNFEQEYLGAFPENSLKNSVDKSVLIKNIKKFYAAKGTDQSIRFIFNSIIAKEPNDIPTVYYPKDNTYKASNGQWIDKFALKVRVISGDISKIIGEKIVQEENPFDLNIKSAFSYVDNIIDIGDDFYEIVLSRNDIVGEFAVSTETYLTKNLLSSDSTNKKINVYSTLGWKQKSGQLVIGTELISYKNKNVSQFVIDSRGSLPSTYTVNEPVYNYSNVYCDYIDNSGTKQRVRLLVLGILYSLIPSVSLPYSKENDNVQISDSGFETRETIIFDKFSNDTRWFINETNAAPTSDHSNITSQLTDIISDVTAIYEDAEYYYIATSGYPSHKIGKANWNVSLFDQKKLKLIKKVPSVTTEIYQTPSNEVGIFVNGTTARSYKDTDDNLVIFGEIQNIILTNPGSGYKKSPYVLVQDGAGSLVASAKAILNGEVIDRIEVVESGTGFFPPVPTITITSGRGAVVTPVVTGDKVTSLKIVNPGEYYSSPPQVVIKDSTGKGRFARFEAIISDDGEIIDFKKLDEGKFYTQSTTSVEIISNGSGATAISNVRSWRRNLFNKHFNNLDNDNGFYFLNNDISLEYGYSYLANPKSLRISLSDNLDQFGNVTNILSHSPILGYAFDGNPIYGPYAYSDPSDSGSSIVRMTSSYSLNNRRPKGPSTTTYPLGSFVEDYQYNHRSGSLDENNGRFCVTPDYPEGTYAYFLTIDAAGQPVFPYILGNNFYSLPVDSNYSKKISQDDIPINITRLKTQKTPNDGKGAQSYINTVSSGSISSATVEYSPLTFSPGSLIEVDSSGTGGKDLLAQVSSVNGKNITSIQSQQTKAIKIITENTAYFFADNIITQRNTNATGRCLGNVFDGKTIVLYNVNGTFNDVDDLYSSTVVYNLLLDKESDYTSGETLSLTNGKQSIIIRTENSSFVVAQNLFEDGEPVIFTNSFSGIVSNQIYYVTQSTATTFKVSNSVGGTAIVITNNSSPGAVAISRKATGLILETTTNRNLVKVQLLQGDFSIDSDYFLRSTSLNDTIGSKISQKFILSDEIVPLSINDKISIVTTSENHGVGIGDKVNVVIDPNDATTETTIYTRSRIYQKVKLNTIKFTKYINDTGIGRLFTLNNGSYKNNNGNIVGDYANGGNATFTQVELIFADITKCRDSEGRIVGDSDLAVIGRQGNPNNARATINVTNGVVTSVTITSKGVGYKRGDFLTVSSTSLNRSLTSTSTRFYFAEVQHVGFSQQETRLFLNDVTSISQNDYLQITDEIVKVTNINTANSYVDVQRSQFNTIAVDHYNTKPVSSYRERYNLPVDFHIGNSNADAYVLNYDGEKQELTLVYEISNTLASINQLFSGSSFFDNSSPKKLIVVEENISNPQYKFEFSYDNITWLTNPELKLQEYYKYKFDTSHFTLRGSFLEFSPSKNYNIITTESKRNNILPGNSGSFITLKIGYGSDIEGNNYSNRIPINYSLYFYFDKNSRISSDGSFVRITPDPLQGNKIVSYVTSNSFVYEMNSYPQYDGSGSIKYTTSAGLAVGSIASVSIVNQGLNYKELPTVTGVRPSVNNECIAEVVWNSTAKNITSVIISNPGINYAKPKAVLISSTGENAEFNVIKNSDGSIRGIPVINRGNGYLSKPEIKIVESDVKIYFESSNIGIPNSIKILYNGKNYGNDRSIRKKYSSPLILKLKQISAGSFSDGERIEQYDGTTLIASGYVSYKGYKNNTNILRLERVSGQFKNNLQITGKNNYATAIVSGSFASLFDSDIKSYYDNLGYYISDQSQLSSNNQKLTDSYFYQDYSYVIKSKTPIDVWRNLIRQTVHPAGFQLFGEVSVESSTDVKLPQTQPRQEKASIIQLWDPVKNKISVENTYRTITQSSIRLGDTNLLPGKGSIFSPSYDTGETSSFEFKLSPEFNGYYDSNGNLSGNTTFTAVLLGSNTPYSIVNKNNIFITLDGILQEPGKAFDIVSGQIVFSQPPLGYRNGYTRSANIISVNNGYIYAETANAFSINEPIIFSDNFSNVSKSQLYYVVEVNGLGFKIALGTFGSPQGAALNLTNVSSISVVATSQINPGDPILFNQYREGVDTPTQKFVGRIIRFKDNTLNTQYFKKIANISSQFNGQTTSFDLRYEDNSAVTLSSNENLIVAIDGVVQRSGVSPLLPLDRSYYIRRTVTPNQIVFVEPPRSGQSFHASSIGSYERLKVDYTRVNDIRRGPFLLRSSVTNKTVTIDNDNNVFVFVDGVLQRRNKTYIIRGANITFVEPLKKGQVINVIYQYGRDYIKSLTAFNYETTPFYNRYEIVLSGEYQNITDGGRLKSNTSRGIVVKSHFNGLNTTLLVDSYNKQFSVGENIEYIDPNESFNNFIINSSNIVSISQFLENEDRQDILQKSTIGWLNGTQKHPSKDFVRIGDLIKIDGESDFRTILTTPYDAVKTDYRNIDNLSYFGKIGTSNYDGISRGEGLDIVAEIENGKVVSLL
jgi:hypothetical protein